MANIRVSVEEEINASPSAVFAVMSDPEKMSQWVKGVESGRWADGASAQPGSRFKLQYKYGRKTNEITMELTAVEPDSKLEYHTVEGPYPIEAQFSLSPTTDGTKVTYVQNAISDSKLATLGFILTGWLARPMMRRQLRKDLVRLGEAAQQTG